MNSTDQMTVGIVGDEFNSLINELKSINNDLRIAMGKTTPVYDALNACWSGVAKDTFWSVFDNTVQESCRAMVQEGEILTANINQIGQWFYEQDQRLSEGMK